MSIKQICSGSTILFLLSFGLRRFRNQFFFVAILTQMEPAETMFFLLSSPKWSKQGSRGASKQATKQGQPRVRTKKKLSALKGVVPFCYPHPRLALQLGYSQPSAFRQPRVRIAKKRGPLGAVRFFFPILTRGWPHILAGPCLAQLHRGSQPSALQAAACEGSNKKNIWRRKGFFVVLTCSCPKGQGPGL